MRQNHPKFILSHFIKMSHILANYIKDQVEKLIRTILKMSLELILQNMDHPAYSGPEVFSFLCIFAQQSDQQ